VAKIGRGCAFYGHWWIENWNFPRGQFFLTLTLFRDNSLIHWFSDHFCDPQNSSSNRGSKSFCLGVRSPTTASTPSPVETGSLFSHLWCIECHSTPTLRYWLRSSFPNPPRRRSPQARIYPRTLSRQACDDETAEDVVIYCSETNSVKLFTENLFRRVKCDTIYAGKEIFGSSDGFLFLPASCFIKFHLLLNFAGNRNGCAPRSVGFLFDKNNAKIQKTALRPPDWGSQKFTTN